jgi:undecaprenyl-diphosphatase
MTVRRVEHMTWGSAIVMGLAQVLALIPGTSRSGITMSAARVMGFEREAAARFSLLMAIPLISAAVLLGAMKIRDAGDAALTGSALLVAAIAFVTALIALAAMMAWLRRASFTPFVIYRLLLGAGLLAWLYA